MKLTRSQLRWCFGRRRKWLWALMALAVGLCGIGFLHDRLVRQRPGAMEVQVVELISELGAGRTTVPRRDAIVEELRDLGPEAEPFIVRAMSEPVWESASDRIYRRWFYDTQVRKALPKRVQDWLYQPAEPKPLSAFLAPHAWRLGPDFCRRHARVFAERVAASSPPMDHWWAFGLYWSFSEWIPESLRQTLIQRPLGSSGIAFAAAGRASVFLAYDHDHSIWNSRFYRHLPEGVVALAENLKTLPLRSNGSIDSLKILRDLGGEAAAAIPGVVDYWDGLVAAVGEAIQTGIDPVTGNSLPGPSPHAAGSAPGDAMQRRLLVQARDPRFRIVTLEALGSIGSGNPEVLRCLREGLRDPHRLVRRAALLELLRTDAIGGEDLVEALEALEAFEGAVATPDRLRIIDALGRLGPEGAVTVPWLNEFVTLSPDEWLMPEEQEYRRQFRKAQHATEWRALLALCRIDDEHFKRNLHILAHWIYEDIAAAQLLIDRKDHSLRIVLHLERLLDDLTGSRRATAAYIVLHHRPGHEAALETLRKAYSQANTVGRLTIGQWLHEHTGETDSWEAALRDHFDSGESARIRDALRSLQERPIQGLVQRLGERLKRLLHYPSHDVRLAAFHVLVEHAPGWLPPVKVE